jgi:hypothetical protein
VRELLASISSEELTEWMAFDQLDPFGAQRDNMHAAVIANVLATVHAKEGHVFKINDFMLEFGKPAVPEKGMSQQEILAMIRDRFGRAPHG